MLAARIQPMKRSLVLAALAAAVFAARAEPAVTVSDPWVRATIAEQTTTAAYLNITARQDSTLVGVSTPVSASAQVHEMKMEGDVMRMRAVDAVPLPAGRAVAFKPGAYHLMLTGLRHALKAGDVVPLTLTVQSAGGQREDVQVRAAVRTGP